MKKFFFCIIEKEREKKSRVYVYRGRRDEMKENWTGEKEVSLIKETQELTDASGDPYGRERR